MTDRFTRNPATIAECGEAQQAFVLENFKALRDEIVVRVSHHERLMWGKIVAIGLLTSFLLTSLLDETLRVIGFAILPGVAVVYDFLVGKNIRSIHCLGIFIRDRLERELYAIPLWESRSGQAAKDAGVRNYGPLDTAVLAVSTAAIMLLASGMVLRTEGWLIAGAVLAGWLAVLAVTLYKVAVMIDYRDGRHLDAVDRAVARAFGQRSG